MINKPFINGFIRMCTYGWHQGWHERNGGNLSYRLSAAEVSDCAGNFSRSGGFLPLGAVVPEMAGGYFLVTGAGSFMRNVPAAPEENIGIVQIGETGSSYRTVWGLTNGSGPTSELVSHVMLHSVKKNNCRVLYHAHPANIVAMTYVVPLNDRDFTRALWKSETECAMVFPEGVGVLDWDVPGSASLAVETGKKMRHYNAVVWAHHGLFCAGADFDQTFGLMHVIEKAAEIYVKVRSMGGAVRAENGTMQEISSGHLLKLAVENELELNLNFI